MTRIEPKIGNKHKRKISKKQTKQLDKKIINLIMMLTRILQEKYS